MRKKVFIIKRESRGFTLVELLVYIGLLSIFLIVLTDIFTKILAVRSESEATSSVEQDGRFILSRITYDINRATQITSPASPGAPQNTLSFVVSGSVYAYTLNSGNLILQQILGATGNLNSSETNVTSITFQRIGNSTPRDTIRIIFTIQSKTQRPIGPETRTFTTTVAPR